MKMQTCANISSILTDVAALGVPVPVVNVIDQIITANVPDYLLYDPVKTTPPPTSLPDVANLIRRLSMSKANLLGSELVFDPAWHMLLALFDEKARGRTVTVSGLCYASGVSYTTALRVLGALERKGMIKKSSDPNDGRRLIVEPEGRIMSKLARALQNLCAGIPINHEDTGTKQRQVYGTVK